MKMLNKIIDWFMPTFPVLHFAPPGEGGGGDDLESALKDAGEATGKISFVGLGEEADSDDDSDDQEEDQEEEDKEDKDKKKSAIMSTFDEHVSEDEDEDEGKEDDGENEDEEDTEEEDDSDDLDEKYPDIDDDIQGSPSIKEKFKRLNGQRRELLSDLRRERREHQAKLKEAQEAQSTETVDVKETDEYKDIKIQNQKLQEIVDQVALEHSAPFQEKFDNKIKAEVKRASAFVKAIDDKQTREEVIAGLDALMAVPPGEDSDPAFYKALNKVARQMDDNGDLVKTRMQNIRELQNERAEALENVVDSKAGFAALAKQQMKQRTGDTIKKFDMLMRHYEEDNADRLNMYREHEEEFMYEKVTGPLVAMAKEELEASLYSGEPTPKLLALVLNGTQYSHAMLQLSQLWDIATKLQEDNTKLKGGKVRKTKAGRSPKRKGPKKSKFDPSKGSAIVATMREMEDAGTIGD